MVNNIPIDIPAESLVMVGLVVTVIVESGSSPLILTCHLRFVPVKRKKMVDIANMCH
ncbi:hypothetical protein HanIR_Chr05g0239271 [Helianthus annuus]|nr:hypothetical protein HanIR_Chr05g0239271 [Helianthus annuus]